MTIQDLIVAADKAIDDEDREENTGRRVNSILTIFNLTSVYEGR